VNGDFQCIRSETDLEAMACSAKHKRMGDFKKYWDGTRTAPYLTIFIGGNHEASNYLFELYYGGWVANNIYYLGKCSVIEVAGFRIAGSSGIYNERNYRKGYYETIPLNEYEKKSIYNVREYEALKLSLIHNKIDIMMSHDWPSTAIKHGDYKSLIIYKPHFEKDIKKSQLGNSMTGYLIKKLKPAIWFSGHMHAHYKATVKHKAGGQTEFLALDKAIPGRIWFKPLKLEKTEDGSISITEHLNLPKREEMQVEDIKEEVKVRPSLKIYYDAEWLAITKVTDSLMSLKINADYFSLMKSYPYYARHNTSKNPPHDWSTSIMELKKAIQEEMVMYKEKKEVYPFNLATENNCNKQTLEFMEYLKIHSKLYKHSTKTAKEIDRKSVV
jgi:lariat debranching enzyme